MPNSSEFQYIAVDQIHESATNPRRTFEETKLAELAGSIRSNGLESGVVRPNGDGLSSAGVNTGRTKNRTCYRRDTYLATHDAR